MMDDQPEPATARTWLRPAVQAGFVLASILIGLEFRRFVLSLADPSAGPVTHRPPAAEAYLPISSLMSLTYWVKSGVVNRVHPAGMVLFSLVLVMALAMRRGFCSWVCPFALASEWAHKVGHRIMGRNVPMPKWLDIVLRLPRYALLAFFVVLILRMPTEGLRQWRNHRRGVHLRPADRSRLRLLALGDAGGHVPALLRHDRGYRPSAAVSAAEQGSRT